MSKRAIEDHAAADVSRELAQSEALLKNGSLGLETLNLRTWYDAFREASALNPLRTTDLPIG